MKILHIETGRKLAGGPQQVVTLMQGLEKMGVESLLLCPDDSAVAELAKSAELKVKKIRYKGEHDISLIKQIKETAQDRHFDLLHAHSRRGADTYTAIAARLTKIPAVLTRRVINEDNLLIAGPKYNSYKKIVAVSEAVDRSLKRQKVFPENRQVIHDGINLDNYVEQYSREYLLTEFGLPENAFIIGNVGRFTENKGQLSLLKAFALIHQRYPHAHLILFGDGKMQDDLEKCIEKNHLEKQVHFAGFRNDMPKWYSALTIVVHTAMLEALSVALIEASACGLPIIAFNTGGISEVVRHMQNGLLVDSGRIDKLAHAIEKILASKTLAAKLGEASRKRCEEFFTAELMVNKYYQLYSEILDSESALQIKVANDDN